MSDNILDHVEKHTGPRSCPECGYQYPLVKFIKRFLLSFGLSKWKCQRCGELIKCDFIKIRFFWLLGLVPFGFLFSLLMSNFDLGLFNFIFLLPFFAFVLLTFHYTKFEKQEQASAD